MMLQRPPPDKSAGSANAGSESAATGSAAGARVISIKIRPQDREGLCERGFLEWWDVEDRDRVREAAQVAWDVLAYELLRAIRAAATIRAEIRRYQST
jgi:hypothetical protein